jgi:predicted dehydrogenase
MPPVEIVVVGAGGRGANAYAPYAAAHPDELRIVAVAEPDAERRARLAHAHNIPAERQFADWRELLAKPQLADGALVTTQDQMHVEPTMAALGAGYHVLLEKPIAPSVAECVALVQESERRNRTLQICHVLRYTNFFTTLKAVLESGVLGDLITVEHRENVAAYHMAHSFVRGNWRRQDQSNPMLLAKCCHDLDILVWNMARPAVRLSSIGSLMHFRAEHAPAGAPARCTDGCPAEESCPFSAIAIYLDGVPFRARLGPPAAGERPMPEAPRTWPFNVVSHDPSYEARLRALQEGPYGRCVYRCDNDVVDHQVVAMEFAGGTSVTLTMHGHSNEEHRSMRYDGTRATLRGRFGLHSEITIHNHRTGRAEEVPIAQAADSHGGGDFGLMRSFVRVLRGEEAARTTARDSLESHLLAFAAEEARLDGTVVDMTAYRARAEELGGGA